MLLFCAGFMLITTLMISFYTNSISRSLNLSSHHAMSVLSNGEYERFVVWTYPTPPPKDELVAGEILYCSYAPCEPITNEYALNPYYVDPRVLNLKEITKGASLHTFHEFVQKHSWFKMIHGTIFPHHVQSVALLSIVQANPKACVRTLGQHDQIICSHNFHYYNKYNPLKVDSIPPLGAKDLAFTERFGILDYQHRVEKRHKVATTEDEMQSLSALQFMPYMTEFIDQDVDLRNTGGYWFANACWREDIAFPPPPINDFKSIPALIGMHVPVNDETITETFTNNVAYFQAYNNIFGPIGASDMATLDFFFSMGLSSYHSAPFTAMMMVADEGDKSQKDLIIVADVDPSILPSTVVTRAKFLSTILEKSPANKREIRYSHAHDIIIQIAERAKVLVTCNIQLSMIAMAHRVPVIYVVRDGQEDHQRYGNAGLLHLYHEKQEWNFDVENMPPNPGMHVFDRHRASFLHYLKRMSTFYLDNAKLFGMIPLQRVGNAIEPSEIETHDTFHFIFTTPPETITWRVIRAVETVFHHHPNAKVFLHSNSIPQYGSKFDSFVESGYDFDIQPYSIEKLLNSATSFLDEKLITTFSSVLQDRRKEQYWYSHETDIVRMLLMEENGGVYLDTDQYLVKPLPITLENVLGWQDPDHKMINGAAMIFTQHNEFLRSTLHKAMELVTFHYDPNNWGIVGPNLLTSQYQKLQNTNEGDVLVLSDKAFYPYVFYKAKDCFVANADNPIDDVETYTVHLNTKMTQDIEYAEPGSVCDSLFRRFCLFCDEIVTRAPTPPASTSAIV